MTTSLSLRLTVTIAAKKMAKRLVKWLVVARGEGFEPKELISDDETVIVPIAAENQDKMSGQMVVSGI